MVYESVHERVGDIDMTIDIDKGRDSFQELFSTWHPATVLLKTRFCWCKSRWREVTRP